jgi:ribonuclease D
MTIELHQDDLPEGLDFGGCVAVDSETMGLNLGRDRLCLLQLSAGDGNCHLVQFRDADYRAPNLKALLGDPAVTKLFHFARFDLAMIERHLGVACRPVYCTKIASKLARTFTDRHGLKDLCKELLRDKLDAILAREGRSALAAACFEFLPVRAKLDLAGWPDVDIFAH